MRNLIRIESQNRKNHGPRKVYVLKCAFDTCTKEIKHRSDSLRRSKNLMCKRHNARKKPYESIYNSLMKDWRKLENTLTYEQYLQFTKDKNCYYCDTPIKRNQYGTLSRAYYLDRKDNSLGYSKENCVSCCTYCNMLKGSLNEGEFIIVCSKIHDTFIKRIFKVSGLDAYLKQSLAEVKSI